MLEKIEKMIKQCLHRGENMYFVKIKIGKWKYETKHNNEPQWHLFLRLQIITIIIIPANSATEHTCYGQ